MLSAVNLPQFVKFLCVGVLNTCFGYSIFALVYLVSGDYRVAIVVATIIGVLFNFFTTGRIVFSNKTLRALVPFILGYAVVCVLNIGLVDLICRFGHSPLVAQLIALPSLVMTAYLINSHLVFAKVAPASRLRPLEETAR